MIWGEDDLREELGTERCTMGGLGNSRKKWAGSMDEDRPLGKAGDSREGRMKRTRLRFRWLDHIRKVSKKANVSDKDINTRRKTLEEGRAQGHAHS